MTEHHGFLPCSSQSRACRVAITVGFLVALCAMVTVGAHLAAEGASIVTLLFMAAGAVGLVALGVHMVRLRAADLNDASWH